MGHSRRGTPALHLALSGSRRLPLAQARLAEGCWWPEGRPQLELSWRFPLLSKRLNAGLPVGGAGPPFIPPPLTLRISLLSKSLQSDGKMGGNN